MARRRREIDTEQEMLDLARERVQLPPGNLHLKYLPETDLLVIRLKENPYPTRTEDDAERGLIFNYEGDQLVSIEMLDLYGIYAS